MLSQELVQDLEHEFLNIDSYFEANNDEDIWSTASQCTETRQDDDDAIDPREFGTQEEDDYDDDLTPTAAASAQVKPISLHQPSTVPVIKKESTPEHECGCCHDELQEDDLPAVDVKPEFTTTYGSQLPNSASTSGPIEPVDMLDDGSWLDFDPSSTGSALISPTLLRRFAMDPKATASTEQELLDGDDDDDLLLTDDFDLPDFSDVDITGLVPSPLPQSSMGLTISSSSSSSSTTTSTSTDAMPRNPLVSPTIAAVAPLPSPTAFTGHPNSVFVSDQDIPDMVNLFSSMYSPSEKARSQSIHNSVPPVPPQSHTQLPPAPVAKATPVPVAPRHQPPPQQQKQFPSAHQAPASTQPQPPLTIMVPNPQLYATMFPFANPGTSVPPQSHQNVSMPSTTTTGTPALQNGQQFEYFTPPGVTTNRALDPSSVFLSADTMSPPTKATSAGIFQNPALVRTHAQMHAHAQAAAAAAVAMANSAAAINTMRKLNTTYGVPIAPLQRSIVADVLPLKPKVLSATGGIAGAPTTISATFGNSTKVSKISITPDISDFKLVQIFHNFCDPMTKVLSLQRFHQLLLHHQVKDDSASQLASTLNSSSSSTPSQESQNLFKILDKKSHGFLDLETFMSSFQICNRCTEAKRRAHSAICAAQGQSFVPTALERQLMEDVAPVIVRVVPTSFEGNKVKSCEHYQWTWCEGFDKTGNEKCKGTNRHDKCPKYLANCTLWKHKLPPKNRKSKVFENIESPSKKLRHFA